MGVGCHLREKVKELEFLRKILSWDFQAKSVQNGPKMRFFKFYEKSTRRIFLNFV